MAKRTGPALALNTPSAAMARTGPAAAVNTPFWGHGEADLTGPGCKYAILGLGEADRTGPGCKYLGPWRGRPDRPRL